MSEHVTVVGYNPKPFAPVSTVVYHIFITRTYLPSFYKGDPQS